MDDEITPRLTLPLVAAGQMQKHVTLNETLTRLDALAQASAVSRSQSSPPFEAEVGSAWLLPEGASGAWSAFEPGDLVRLDLDGWSAVSVTEGLRLWIADEGRLVIRHGDGWAPLGDVLGAVRGLERLSLGTDADDGPALSARLEAALLSARPTEEGGTGDVRLTLNRLSDTDVASLILQTGFSGRAELGLVGDDDFTIRVSADGEVWTEALRIGIEDGRVTAASGLMRRETTPFLADGTWNLPPWARRVEAILIGGGGGGGGGRLAASGPAPAGGGGGAGGLTRRIWSADQLTASLSIQVGAGGLGAAPGDAGGHGGDSLISLDGVVLAAARGGRRGDVSGGEGGQASWPGAAGGDAFGGGAGAAGGNSAITPGGGGGGGGVDAAGVGHAAGAGGSGALCGRASEGGAAGSGSGGSGADGGPAGEGCGGGGAGGAPGHAGGDGGLFGGGGGGGGAHPVTPGRGGDGAAGLVILVAEG